MSCPRGVAQAVALLVGCALALPFLHPIADALSRFEPNASRMTADFHTAFFIVAVISAAASLSFMRLAPDAGNAVSGHGRLTTPKELEPISPPGN